MSNIVNKVKDAIHGGHGSHTHGPHDSKTANKMDPRVDSDMGTSRGLVARHHVNQ